MYVKLINNLNRKGYKMMKLYFYVSVMCVVVGLVGQIENVYVNDVNDFKFVYKLRIDNECWLINLVNGVNSGECVIRSEY